MCQVDEGRLPSEHPLPLAAPDFTTSLAQKRVAATPTRKKTATAKRVVKRTADAAGIVDVGIFYTQNAMNLGGGQTNIQATIRAAIVTANAVYAASQLKVTVHSTSHIASPTRRIRTPYTALIAIDHSPRMHVIATDPKTSCDRRHLSVIDRPVDDGAGDTEFEVHGSGPRLQVRTLNSPSQLIASGITMSV